MTYDEVMAVFDTAECLFTEDQVNKELDNLARLITEHHQNTCPIILCVMTGGIIPVGHLLTRLNFPLEVDYVHATRYQGDIKGGELHWKGKPTISLQGREVIIVDDILDEGHTLSAIIEFCKHAGARNVYSLVLVEKMHSRKQGVKADYVGLQIDDRYVFGYGMDYKGWLRNTNGIYAVKDIEK